MSDHWYGHGPKPEKRFYGILDESRSSQHPITEMLKRKEIERMEMLKKKYPNFALLERELLDAEDAYKHQGIALEQLREEHKLLKKILGIDNGEA